MSEIAKLGTGIKAFFNAREILEVKSVEHPQVSIEKVDATSFDSPCTVSIPGILTYGDLKIEGHFVNDGNQQALLRAARDKTVGKWTVIFPAVFGGLVYTFRGFVTETSLATPIKGDPASYSIAIAPTTDVRCLQDTDLYTGRLLQENQQEDGISTKTETVHGGLLAKLAVNNQHLRLTGDAQHQIVRYALGEAQKHGTFGPSTSTRSVAQIVTDGGHDIRVFVGGVEQVRDSNQMAAVSVTIPPEGMVVVGVERINPKTDADVALYILDLTTPPSHKIADDNATKQTVEESAK